MRVCRARVWGGIGILFFISALSGCAPQQAPPPAAVPPTSPVLSSDDYGAVKSSYLAANPTARVGRVTAVLPDQQRVAVGDVPVADFRKGDVLTIVDSGLNPIADAIVVDLDADLLYLHYVPVTVGSRAPLIGDLAIRAQSPDRSPAP